MADGRMLSKKISLNEAVASLENDTHRVLFTWGLSHLDIEGRISGNPKVFRAMVVPLLEHITSEKVAKFFKDAVDKELILHYQVGKEWFIQYPKFKDNQRLRPDREAPSKIPPPPNVLLQAPGELPSNSGSSPGEPPENSGLKLSKGKLSEEEDKIKLSEGDGPTPPEGSVEPLTPEFSFSCPHFDIEPDYFQQLQADYPGLDYNRLLAEIKKAADYCSDNPKKHKRNSRGKLVNKRLYLRNWIERAQVQGERGHPLSKAEQVTAANLRAAREAME